MNKIDLNDKFQVGRFYGFTAPQLMLTSRATLSRLLQVVANTTSVDALNDLRTEVIALEMILTGNPEVKQIFTYNETAQTDDYLKQLKVIAPHIYTAWGEPQDFKQLQRKRVSTLASLDKAVTANELGQDFTPYVKTLGLTDIQEVIEWQESLRKVNESATSISNKVELDYNELKDTVLLSSNATKLLNAVYNGMMHTENGKTKARWFVDRINTTLLTKVSNNTPYFGENLWTLNNAKSPLQFNRINKTYQNEVNSNGKNKQSTLVTLTKYIEQCNALLELNNKEDNTNTSSAFNLPSIDQLQEYITKGKPSTIPSELAVALQDEDNAKLILRIAKTIGVKKSWYNDEVVNAILNFNSTHMNILRSEIEPHLTDIKDDEEMQDVFDELSFVGAIGLTVFGVEIMIEEIERQSLARKDSLKNKAEPSYELQNNTALMLTDAESKLKRLQMNEERGNYYAYESLGNLRL